MRVLDLQRIRAEKKVSQVRVAELTGYPQGFVSVLERGKASAPEAFIEKVASALGVDNIENYVSEVANPNLQKKMAERDNTAKEKPAVAMTDGTAVSPEQAIVSNFLELLKKKEEKIEKLEAENEALRHELSLLKQGRAN